MLRESSHCMKEVGLKMYLASNVEINLRLQGRGLLQNSVHAVNEIISNVCGAFRSPSSFPSAIAYGWRLNGHLFDSNTYCCAKLYLVRYV